jgi:hypothetical protein
MDYLKFSIKDNELNAFVVDNLGSLACWAHGTLPESNLDCDFHVNDIAKFLGIIKKLKQDITITNDNKLIIINDGTKKVEFEKFHIQKLETAYSNFQLINTPLGTYNEYTVKLPNVEFVYINKLIVNGESLHEALSFSKESRGSDFILKEDNYKLTIESKLGLTVLTDTIDYIQKTNSPPFPVTFSDYLLMVTSKFKNNITLLFTDNSKQPYAVEAKEDTLTYLYWMATKP